MRHKVKTFMYTEKSKFPGLYKIKFIKNLEQNLKNIMQKIIVSSCIN
jgi:hypothetical protein